MNDLAPCGLIFLHVPRTAGTSIEDALLEHFSASSFSIKAKASLAAACSLFGAEEPVIADEQIQALRISLLHYAAALQRRFLYGHVWFDESCEALRSRGYLLFTCLREPIDRWFSQFLWDRYKTSQHRRIRQDIDDFLCTDEARRLGSMYVRYLGGVREDRDYRSSEAVRAAVERCSRLDLVGRFEDLDALRRLFRERLDLDLSLGLAKPSPAPSAEAERIRASTECRKAVEALCRPDLELFHRIGGDGR